MQAASHFPAFDEVIKSRDVEDPINLNFNRRLAYWFVRSVRHTRLTPNHVTLIAVLIGVCAAGCWLIGTKKAMVVGGVLLWVSAIFDGADGILARAKKLFSPFGRPIDGTADLFVTVVTLGAAGMHLYKHSADIAYLLLGLPWVLSLAVHTSVYDFHKELYLKFVRADAKRDYQSQEERQKHFQAGGTEKKPWWIRFIVEDIYRSFLESQQRYVRLVNPRGLDLIKTELHLKPTAAQLYRKHNYVPMQCWAAISFAPHNYLMAICAMLDRLDIYFWIRLVGMNALFFILIPLQRRATRRTFTELGLG